MAIKIKRSTGDLAPASLAAGQLAYSEGSTNGGTLYYGEIGGTVREIGGRKYVDKLNGIEAGAEVNAVDSVNGQTGAVTLGVSDISGAEDTANKGQANGYASLDSSGLVPSSQLPSYVDDVIEGANLAAFPSTGATGKIYVAVDTGKTYRWSGSTYVEISASPGSTDSVTEGSTNLYYTDARARAAISVTDTGGDGSLSYNNSTGVLTFTGPSASDVRAHFSAGTGISITNGAIATTITQYTDSAARAAISVTQNLSYNSSTGVITGPDLSGYLTSESDPVFTASAAGGITSTQVTNWDTAYGWGDHGAAGYISAVEDDTSPLLSGNLNVDGNSITTTETDGNITLQPNGDGRVVIDGTNATDGVAVLQVGDIVNTGTDDMVLNSTAGISLEATGSVAIQGLIYPSADGDADQVLVTDGAGNLSWADQTAGVTTFVALTDTPSAFTGAAGYYVKVNSGATALEFSQDVDDGTF